MGDSKDTTDTDSLPLEVSLIPAIKQCNKCRWFWGEIPPYGPFNVYDWDELYPSDIPQNPVAKKVNNPNEQVTPVSFMPKPWSTVVPGGLNQTEPAPLRGCRKAPIMTVGINPNMTAFFASSQSTSWAYPRFRHIETYAYYYRHAHRYQESLSLEFLKQDIIPGSQVLSPVDGLMTVSRSDSHRWMLFEFTPSDDAEDTVRIEGSWGLDSRLVVFAENATDNRGEYRVYKNELVAARIGGQLQEETAVFSNQVDYYARLDPVLTRFERRLRDSGFPECAITLGEDISLHDLVACASPGWGKRYDIPQQAIAHNCVIDQRFMLNQLLQSRPRIAIIVSGSTLQMFHEGATAMGAKIDLEIDGRDIYDLLEETASRRVLFSTESGGDLLETRLIITPHFSYETNFRNQSRFSWDDWLAFKEARPGDAETLENSHRINHLEDDAWMGVFLETDDELEKELSEDAWQELMSRHVSPFDEILKALWSEHDHEPLITDRQRTSLDRSEGPCSFCCNAKWQFPEGCPYGKIP